MFPIAREFIDLASGIFYRVEGEADSGAKCFSLF
jgi:hypothetical protein